MPKVAQSECKTIFQSHPDSFCIVYDDEECKGTDGLKAFDKGESITEPPEAFDAESISVRKGCQFTVNTGKINYSRKEL